MEVESFNCLALYDIIPPHTGEKLANKIFGSRWLVVMDYCVMISFFFIRYCAQVLNLIMQERLSVATDLLKNIKDNVKFVKAYDSRKEAFAACVESVRIKSGNGLFLDIPTRLNSTYDMLAKALKFCKAFSSLTAFVRNYKSLLSKDEWNRGERIYDYLKFFSTITTYFSAGVKYPITDVYFLQV